MASFSMAAPTPTQSIGHLPHINPTAGPTQLSKTHPNIVNYAISAGGVLLGLAIIGGFALILRCNRRRKKRQLEAEIDVRIHEKTLSRMALHGSRNQSLAKVPNAAMSRAQSAVYPLPLMTAGRLSSANSSTETLAVPRARATCIRASDQRLPCGCPDCVVLTRAASLRDGFPSGSVSGLPGRLGSGSRGSLLNPHPAVRYSHARFSRASSSPGRSPGSRATVASQRGVHHPTTTHSPRARSGTPRNDENVFRADSPRGEPASRMESPRADWATSFAIAAHSGVPLGYPHGIGMGIVAATTTGALGCPSPATPALVSTPQIIGSAFGSPALSLSDDAGATSISPGTPPHVSLGSLGTLGSLARAGGSFARSGTGSSLGTTGGGSKCMGSSLEQATSRGYLGSGSAGSLAHMHVSPHVATPAQGHGTLAAPRLSPELAYGQVGADAYTFPRVSPKAMGEMPQQGTYAVDGASNEEKWFTEVDWFAEDGPINLSYYEKPNAVSASQVSGYEDRYDNHNGMVV
ncbi:hypothetical protein BN946_scf184920.g38 [Trametes cinnabarina]|uniref:Uncharacterized protein n=1 Tax=Pycnoporus cinnabarinus TaxID=5643 RepID=A0A060SHR2_PYCCI|nr:hypothetical protein BN946_scf184920.g38 [Trametes cinnabarina]